MTHAPIDVDINGGSRPTVREYKVLWNKPQGKRLLLLQFPSKSHNTPFNNARRSKPLEIRIKPLSGLLEVDIPIHLDSRYDHDKGVKFGQALRQSKLLQTGGGYGLPGGFAVNAQVRHGRSTGVTRRDESEGVYEGNRSLMRLTMGGKLRFLDSSDPTYAIGIFRGGKCPLRNDDMAEAKACEDELHLSKVDGICSLQPQFHHLDAVADYERSANRTSGPDQPTVDSEARAVNMLVKSADSEQFDVAETDRTLRTMQEEPWQKLEWIDEADARAHTTLENGLILSDSETHAELVSAMTERQYLDAISAPRIDPFRQGKRVIINRPWYDDDREGVLEEDEPGTGEVSAERGTASSSKAGPIKTKIEND